MESIRKLIDFEVKEVEGEDRTLSAVASTGLRDRDGDIIEPEGWKLKNFRKNPVILWGHTYTGKDALPIAKATEIKVEDGKLRFKAKFVEKEIYEFADTVYKLYKNKYLRTFSVGFIPFKREEISDEDYEKEKGLISGGYRYTSQELLEISGCPVPSNAEALADKSMGEVMAKSFGLVKPEDEDKNTLDFDLDSRMPHHNEANGDIVPEKVIASMAFILGARGGIDLESDTKIAIYRHLSRHYESMKKEVPEFREYTEAELRDMFNDVWFDELGDIVNAELEREDIEKDIKSGRVLSEKNRSLVKKCADMLTELYNASEPPSDDGKSEIDDEELQKISDDLAKIKQEIAS